MMANYHVESGQQFSRRSMLLWRIAQTLVWLIGATIFLNLIFYPSLGLQLFWNVLIPVAPALFVVGIGVWRNVCPLASTGLLPRYLGFSKRIILTDAQTGQLSLLAVIILFLIVPLRHAIFDMSGSATAILIMSLTMIAVIMGFLFEWKSGWCASLCPIYPVEKLYGINNRYSSPNVHCDKCFRCVIPCPDSTSGISPLFSKRFTSQKLAGFLMAGGFPGLVWGWFQVPATPGVTGVYQLLTIYKLPMAGLIVTSALFLILRKIITDKVLVAVFSAAAVSCYYWFKLPALFGYGVFPGDGMLFDLTRSLPEWILTATAIAMTVFLFWWIVFRKKGKTTWLIRPAYGVGTNSNQRLSG